MTQSPASRHLTWQNLTQYLNLGAPSVIPISGTPTAFLVIDSGSGSIGIRIDRQAGEPPDLEDLKHLVATTVSWDGRQWVDIRVAEEVDLFEAYQSLCAILDRVQLEGEPTGSAVLRSLENLRVMLAELERLSDEAEVGLVGELLTLGHFIPSVGEGVALEAWCGPDAAEHDFCLPAYDLEVKSTTAEVRQHWVNDLSQLVPSPSRPLLFLSVQLTTGGSAGLRLPELIGKVREALSPEGQKRLDLVLRDRFYWNPTRTSRYRRRFRLRSQAAPYLVDEDFPAITPAVLTKAGLDLNHFTKVRYQIDVSGLSAMSDTANNLHLIGTSLL